LPGVFCHTYFTSKRIYLGRRLNNLFHLFPQIFNQLVIAAAAIYSSKNQRLVLDPVPLMRDVVFYALSLLCFYNALTDRRAVDDDGMEYVFVSKFDSALLVGCYVLYVIVCAKYDKILNFLNIDSAKECDEDGQHYEAFDEKLEGGALKVKSNACKDISFETFIRILTTDSFRSNGRNKFLSVKFTTCLL